MYPTISPLIKYPPKKSSSFIFYGYTLQLWYMIQLLTRELVGTRNHHLLKRTWWPVASLARPQSSWPGPAFLFSFGREPRVSVDKRVKKRDSTEDEFQDERQLIVVSLENHAIGSPGKNFKGMLHRSSFTALLCEKEMNYFTQQYPLVN